MKTKLNVLIASGILALIPGWRAQGQEAPAKHRELTMWIASQIGTHIGGGYASTYLTNIRAKTIEKEDPKLRNAIRSLDGLGMLPVKGFGLVPAAVSWKTGTRMRKLIQQQADTGLSYGELLMANTLASKSGETFDQVVARRAKAQTWGELAKKFQVDPDVIVAQANSASKQIVAVEFQTRHRQPQNNSLAGPNPHIQQARHR